MWLEQAKIEALQLLVKKSSSQYLASTIDGNKILWANDSFCEWSQYTLPELLRKTWLELSVNDGDLAADLEMARALVNGDVKSYTVQKRYMPKNSRPEIGNLHVVRYPETGPFEFCWCLWEPLRNGTAQAFELALESQGKMVAIMTELTQEVKTVTNKTEVESFLLSGLRLSIKYPKVAMFLIVVILGLGQADSVVSTLQRLGFLPPPPVIVQEIKHDATK